MKTLFWLPLIMFNWLVPFSAKAYKPASEDQRVRSETLRNEARLAAYYAKRVINRRVDK